MGQASSKGNCCDEISPRNEVGGKDSEIDSHGIATPKIPNPFHTQVSMEWNLKRSSIHPNSSCTIESISHYRQMMELWTHLDALMYRMFPSSLGDLELR